MLVLLIICLVFTIGSIEYYIFTGQHSSDQRLLPLVLGLVSLYDFYMLVEYISPADNIFFVLKHLLLVQMLFLLIFYSLDFTNTKLPGYLYWILFGFVVVFVSIVVAVFLQGQFIRNLVLAMAILFISVLIAVSTYTLVVSMHSKKVHKLYQILYFAMMIPAVGLILTEFQVFPEKIIMPICNSIFVFAIMFLLAKGTFTETQKYLKEDLFYNYDGALVLFDKDLYFIEASHKAREDFPDYIQDMEVNRSKYKVKDILIDIIENHNNVFFFDIEDLHYKLSVQHVLSNDKSKKLKGYIVTFSNITDEVNARLEAQNESKNKGHFLANMSHELRSPLNAIIGCSEIVMGNNDLSFENRSMLNNIKDAGHDLLEIVNSILDYSKIDAGKFELNIEPYDIRLVLEKLAYDAVVILRDKDVHFSVDIKNDIPKLVLGDQARVRSIFQNLISNASKFTNQGYVKCMLESELSDNDNIKFTFSVNDTAGGMSKEQIENIFNEYTSYSEKYKVSGTGLGLTVVQKLTEMMNGETLVESDGETGSTFTAVFYQQVASKEVYTPSVLDENVMNKTFGNDLNRVMPSYIYPTAKVLVVDDMKVNQDVIARMMLPWQLDVKKASNGFEAIEIAKDYEPDLVFMDQMMPEMDGITTAEEIMKFSNAPIVMLTADISDEMITASVEHGFSGYIPKPIEVENIKKALEGLLPVEKCEQAPFDAAGDRAKQLAAIDKTYRYALEAYIEEIEELLVTLPEYLENDLDTFRVKVHGIKGTSRQLKRPYIGEFAEVIEMCAKLDNVDFIKRHFKRFLNDLSCSAEEAREEIKSGF